MKKSKPIITTAEQVAIVEASILDIREHAKEIVGYAEIVQCAGVLANYRLMVLHDSRIQEKIK